MKIWGYCLVATAMLAVTASAIGGARPGGWRWPALPSGAKAPRIPADNAMTAAKVELGRRLFYDADLSRDGTMSCATCHEQKRGFTDGNSTHAGVFGDPGIRNVQGLANVAWRSPLTWADAMVTTLERQAMVPIAGDHPVEMGMKDGEAELARRLGADSCYRQMFAKAFPARAGRIDFPAISDALASFERTLISSDAPYDRYRAGNNNALSPEARRGAAQFTAAGCAACHAGPDLTDDSFHYVGTSATIGGGYGNTPPPKAETDKTETFRTPPLRNVAVTGPWLHDGSAATIEKAIRRHAPAALTKVEMPALLTFMDAQTDTVFLKNPAFSRPTNSCRVAAR